MDLLSRRQNTTSRRGTLLPGGAPRLGDRGQLNASPIAKTTIKTALLDEFRAHEEAEAARVLQRAARGFLGRKFVARLLQQVYRRLYDPIEKQYYYLNTATNETTWEKPQALRMFLTDTQEVPVTTHHAEVDLSPTEAARRLQRFARALLARRMLHRLACDNYMKLFDETTKTFYYLDTRTGIRSPDRPSFLDETHDLPVETFQFRKAVCKVSSNTNLSGTGVLGFFGPGKNATQWLCLLSDATTLPDAATASTAHVVCNYCTDAVSVPFQISLRPEAFFTTLSLEHKAVQFALCAVDRNAFFERAGTNIKPLQFDCTDRKMACADVTRGGFRLQAALEIVGHPHGKPRVIHFRTLTAMRPHSIAPITMVYDTPTESGGAGSAVFTRSGKLLGLQPFIPLKAAAPHECFYIRPILAAATALVTPPEPFLLTTSLSSHEVQVCWSIVRWFKPLPGLAIDYELELGVPLETRAIARFECVYHGPRKSKHVGNLMSDRLYTLRVRACNPITKSSWSQSLTFRTLPTPSLAWRIPRYCTNVRDACKRMKEQSMDVTAQLQGVQWIARHIEQHPEALGEIEAEFIKGHGIEWVLETITTRFPSHESLALLTLRLLTTFTKLQHRTQGILSQVQIMNIIFKLFVDRTTNRKQDLGESVEDIYALPLACVDLLGAVLDGDNPSGQQSAQALELVPLLLEWLAAEDNRIVHEHMPFVASCVFLLARFTHNHTLSGKWQLVTNGRLVVLRDLLDIFATGGDSTIVYWTLVTLGNIAYASTEPNGRAQLVHEIRIHQLIAAVCNARTQFLIRIHDLELAMGVAQREFTRLAASVMGEDMRNEMDAYEHEVHTLTTAIQDLHERGDVAQAAEFALRYLLTDEQRRVQAAAQRLMHQFLYRTQAEAMAKWRTVTIFERNCAVFRTFLTTIRCRQLSAAFRKWELYLREWRRTHKSRVVDAVLGAGLAIDLNKRKKERYRILALQK